MGPWFDTPVWPHTFVSPSADSRRAVVSYWRKYVHEVLVNRLGLSPPRKSVVRLTDCLEMTLDVYRGRKTTTQQQQQAVKTHDPQAYRNMYMTRDSGSVTFDPYPRELYFVTSPCTGFSFVQDAEACTIL